VILATADGVVLKTTDGGANWSPLPVAPGVQLEAVGFVRPDRGWVGALIYAVGDRVYRWTAAASRTDHR